MMRAAVTVVLLSLVATAAGEDRPAPASPGDAGADPLGLRLRAVPRDVATGQLALDPVHPDRGGPTSCPVDWCQPRVDVPGQTTTHGGMSRPELVARLLDDADVAPLASLAWLFAQTGLEVQWTPPHLDAATSASGGKGNLFVRLKLRIDAWNRPSFPVRERDRIRREQEAEAERAQARAAEQADAAAARERARERDAERRAREAERELAREAAQAQAREAEREQAREAERLREATALSVPHA